MEHFNYFNIVMEVSSKETSDGPVFEAESSCEAFHEFMYRFRSLYRYWILCRKSIAFYLEDMESARAKLPGYLRSFDVKNDELGMDEMNPSEFTGELIDIVEDAAYADAEYMPVQIRLTIITFALSMIEHLLDQVCIDLRRKIGEPRPLIYSTSVPYIDKYLSMLSLGFGLKIVREPKLHKSIEVIRDIRNDYVHKLQSDLPEEIQKQISILFSSAVMDEINITDTFVDEALDTLGSLAKLIERAYMKFFNEESVSPSYMK